MTNTITKKFFSILAAAICTLAITATAFAAEFISPEQARSIAAQWVPAGSTHLVTKDESHKYASYYEVKFYDNATNTEYEVEVLKNGGAVKEFKMDAQTVIGSTQVVLSAADVQNLVLKEFPNATFTKVKLDRDDGLYEYELKFYTPELRGEMKFNPENGALIEKELKYQVS
ncbi:PepSY domain-containing protein [Phascolarctobacterium sp.]|uniref:PepSY domain-containing protein n=1 Tax=Phascolarctobacterium sp. TaxID=2049039 RepID=UPI0015B24ED2|nr:PepSY domain-containing protein [uncultured Phascolarctobacterium sp.]